MVKNESVSERVIKFRGKSIEMGRWTYGYYVKAKNKHYILPDIGGFQIEVSPKTVGQYSGLNDKNKKEIYGGDIVLQKYTRDSYGDDEVESTCGSHCGVATITASSGLAIRNPIYTQDGAVIGCIKQYKLIRGYRAEVIGNETDNPDILTKLQPLPKKEIKSEDLPF